MMDINIDQGQPNQDLGRFENGKYLFKNDDGKFDIDKFNREFDQYKIKRKEEMREQIQKKLDILNRPVEEIPPYELSIGEIAVNTKDAIFNIIDDLLNFKFTWNILTREHRLFYLGIFMIMIAIIVYLYWFFMTDEINETGNKVIHVHEIKMID
jgi:hypothetical protein